MGIWCSLPKHTTDYAPPPHWGRKARQRNRFSSLIHPPGCREEEEKELSQFVFPYSQLFSSKRIYSVAQYENSCREKCSKWMDLLVWVNQPLKIRSLSLSDLSERNWYLVQNWYISSFWGLILCDLTWCREIKVSSIQTSASLIWSLRTPFLYFCWTPPFEVKLWTFIDHLPAKCE